MARRNATLSDQSPESNETEGNTHEEQNMTTSTPEATEAPAAENAENAPTENAPTEEELQALVDAVVEAAGEVAPLANQETGELTSEQMKPVVDAYLAIPGRQQKARNAAKDALLEKMKYNIDPTNEGANFITARAYVLMQDELNRTKAAKSGGSTRVSTPVDPTEAFVANAASLILSVKLTQAHFVPEGVDEGWAAKVKELNDSEAVQSDIQKLVDWKATVDAADDGDETPEMPEVQPHVLAAWKQASKAGKVRRTRSGGSASSGVSTYSGPLRSVAKHIAEFAAKHEAGVYPISVVGNFSSEEYSPDHPSSGALSAHLFPKSGKGVRETDTYKGAMTQDGKKGLEVL